MRPKRLKQYFLQLVISIYKYMDRYRYFVSFCQLNFQFSVLSRLSFLHWLSSSLLLYELFLYIYIFLIFFKITLFTPLKIQYSIYGTGIYMSFTEWVMQHISQTILKENKEVVNLILPKTSNNYCTLRNLVRSVHFKESKLQL